jgi:hypothetical protein
MIVSQNGVDTHRVGFGEYYSVRDFFLLLDLQYYPKTTQMEMVELLCVASVDRPCFTGIEE